MTRRFVLSVCVALTLGLLTACQPVNISLAVPTARPTSPGLFGDTPAVASATAAPGTLATMIDLQGAGRWRSSEASGWDCASIGQVLGIENQVLTESGAKAVIEYLDGLLVHVAPKTLFTVTELKQTEDHTLWATIQLLVGELFVSHEGAQASQIRIETGAGIAGVRGTMMSVKVTLSGQMIVTCLEGTCTLENDYGMIVLQAGQQAEILDANLPPVFLGIIADYQLNEWFANQSSALLVALNSGLLAQLPAGCTLEDSLSCQIDLDCDPATGVGCPLPAGCDPLNGSGCELIGGCNPVTGEGCELPPGCDPPSGDGCQLETGCNPVTGQGCAAPLNCNLLTGFGCPLAAGCDPVNGQGCELSSGCNPVTGQGCTCANNNTCAGGAGTVPTGVPTFIPTIPLPPIPTVTFPSIPTLPFP